jgi:hypothetical protein
MRIIAALIGALALPVVAFATNVDWKLCGTASAVDGGTACFYDAMTVTHKADGHMRVWTKCLLIKDLDGLDLGNGELGKKIADQAARRLLDKYFPPITSVETDFSYDQLVAIIEYEQTANLGNIQPSARFFYEINCSERMIQRLSTYIRSDGKEGFSDKPSKWDYIPPEGSAATLLKIVCR